MQRYKEKDYYENLAMVTLKDLFPDKFSSEMRMADKPDLQDSKSGIGVEVTRVLFPHEAEVNRYSLESAEKAKKPSKKAGTADYHMLLPHEKPIRGNGYPVFMPSIEPLLKAFTAKLKKLNEGGYTIFPENNLYLMVTPYDTYTPQKIDEFMLLAEGKQTKHRAFYDHIFIYEYGMFFDCDMNRFVKTRYELTCAQMQSYVSNAREFFNSTL